MDIPPAGQDIPRRDGDDLPPGEAALQDFRRLLIRRVAEGGQDDAAVGDVEVDIAGRQPFAGAAGRFAVHRLQRRAFGLGHINRPGEGELVDGDRAAFRVPLGLEVVKVCHAPLILRVPLVVGPGQHHLAGGGEGADVVHMAVCLVPPDAVGEPEDLFRPEVVPQHLLDLFPGEVRVAAGGEEALFGDHDRPFAVRVDRAALKDEIPAVVAVDVQKVAGLPGDMVVPVPGEIEPVVQPAPGVEPPVDPADFARGVFDDDRRDVPRPGVVGGEFRHPHLGRQRSPRVFVLVIGGENGHLLPPRDGGDDLDKRLPGGVGPAGPAVRPLRPDQETALVGLELGGHIKPVFAGEGVENVHRVSSFIIFMIYA